MKRSYGGRRAKVIAYCGKNRALFECPDGHLFKALVVPKAPNGNVPSDDVCRFMATRWMRTGVTIKPDECPACRE